MFGAQAFHALYECGWIYLYRLFAFRQILKTSSRNQFIQADPAFTEQDRRLWLSADFCWNELNLM